MSMTGFAKGDRWSLNDQLYRVAGRLRGALVFEPENEADSTLLSYSEDDVAEFVERLHAVQLEKDGRPVWTGKVEGSSPGLLFEMREMEVLVSNEKHVRCLVIVRCDRPEVLFVNPISSYPGEKAWREASWQFFMSYWRANEK